jgi:ABC-type dipeptide/oligopeptide/nickel transport system permease subunit
MLEYNDKVYKRISVSGKAGIIIGIISIIIGIIVGVISIVFGAKALATRKHLID